MKRVRKPRRKKARRKYRTDKALPHGPIIGPGECCRPEIRRLVADLRANPLPPLLQLVGRSKRQRLRGLEREQAKDIAAGRKRESRGKTRWREAKDDLRPLEKLLQRAREQRFQEALKEWVEEIQLEADTDPDSYAARKRLQVLKGKMLREFAFTEWVTLQPNGVLSSDRQRLEDVLPKIIRMVNPMAFGKDATKPWNRHKCIQGVVFLEGAIDKHAHIAIFSEYQIDPIDLEHVVTKVFLKFFKKGTVWVDGLDEESRDDVIWYCCKELWRRSSYESVTFFGPNWSNDPMTIPPVGEAHLRRREWAWPVRTVRIPELRDCDPASLKLILQDAQEAGRWMGPDPRTMPYDELEREVRGYVREEADWAEKVVCARAMVSARRRVLLDKYYRRAGAVFIPHAHRLTPDTSCCTSGCSGPPSCLDSFVLSSQSGLPRGPPSMQSNPPVARILHVTRGLATVVP